MEHLVLGLGAVGVSTVIIFAYLVFIWWLDRYEREPFWVVLIAFCWGGVGGTLLGCILSVTMSIPAAELIPTAYADVLMVAVIAPFAEEFTKGLIFVLLVFTPYLDNETDGLIYGAAAGLGFAAVENMLYFLATAAAGDPEVFYATVVMRTLFTALVHAISTALLGYAIGYVRHRRLWPRLWLWPIIGYVLAVANHALWNFLVFASGVEFLSETMTDETMLMAMVFVFFMSGAMFVITQISLMREQQIIGKYLADEAQRGTLPKEHAGVIPSWRNRRKKGWVPPGVPHKEYVEAATLLAFRRYQADTAAKRFEQRYQKRVEENRRKVREMLGGRQG